MTYAAACSNARFLTYWERPGTEPESSWALCWVLNLLSYSGNSSFYFLFFFFFLALACSSLTWDLSSQTRDWTWPQQWKHQIWITRPLGNSLTYILMWLPETLKYLCGSYYISIRLYCLWKGHSLGANCLSLSQCGVIYLKYPKQSQVCLGYGRLQGKPLHTFSGICSLNVSSCFIMSFWKASYYNLSYSP